MAERWVGLVAGSDAVTIVDAQVPEDGDDPITVVADDTWKVQSGDKAKALAVLAQRCADYLREHGINRAVVKASALPSMSVKLGVLHSAEVRGVILGACGTVVPVTIPSKAVISRTFGDRKVDEYLSDDDFWLKQTIGKSLRKSSREAAMLLVASRAD